MRVVALAGGTGSAKLVRGLSKVAPRLTAVANPGDNVWMHGLYVCPDLDIVTYTLAGMADSAKGWGIENDSFETLGQLAVLGQPVWFKLGDRDLATHILRTEMMRKGASLTEVTRRLCELLSVKQNVLPATDEHVETHILTAEGEMHLQEFWVRRRAKPVVKGVRYVGARAARPTRQVAQALHDADLVVFCPANPVTSIGPILAISGMKRLLANSRARVVAVSPMIGDSPFSGPAGVLLKAVGTSPDSVGVASLYAGLLDDFLIHRNDSAKRSEIERFGMKVHLSDTVMSDPGAEARLAKELIAI